ncbi:MAG TPA: cyanophycinase [Azospirillaceae bacterium]|nr:cyanophycinase [Azospirillaceae bacterium]
MSDQPTTPAAAGESPTGDAKGVLVIIGGHEDRKDERVILREFAKQLKGDKKVILSTVASHEPEGYFDEYRRAFDDLGVRDLTELYIEERDEAKDEDTLRDLEKADGVFFSGGDQLRIHQQIGKTPVEKLVREIFMRGGVVAGTSAGAAAMGDLMLVEGASRESHRIGDISFKPGLGLLHGVLVDQHFAQRGRIGRLLGAVAQHPELLGLGIDEDTAIVVKGDSFRVVGSGAVYVVDGLGVTESNVKNGRTDQTLSMFDVRLHVLGHGESFDLSTRRPSSVPDVRDSHEAELKAQGLDPAEGTAAATGGEGSGAAAEPALDSTTLTEAAKALTEAAKALTEVANAPVGKTEAETGASEKEEAGERRD